MTIENTLGVRDATIDEADDYCSGGNEAHRRAVNAVRCQDARHGLIVDSSRLYRLRVAQGMSRRELARRLRAEGVACSAWTIAKIERGLTDPGIKLALDALAILRGEFADLVQCWDCTLPAIGMERKPGEGPEDERHRVRAIGAKIGDARRAAGMSIFRAASAAGVSRQDAVYLERHGGACIGVNEAFRYVELFFPKRTFGELLSDDDGTAEAVLGEACAAAAFAGRACETDEPATV